MPPASREARGIIHLVRPHPAGRSGAGFTKSIETLNKRMQDAKARVPAAEIEGRWPGLEERERRTPSDPAQ